MVRVHGSCVAIGGDGVLLRGDSGAGKSDLALRLIEAGARLVADDQVEIAREGGRLTARAPAALAGLIEVRGVGILRLPCLEAAPLALIVELVAPRLEERLPEPRRGGYLEVALPLVALDPFAASAAAKVRLALALARGDIMAVQ